MKKTAILLSLILMGSAAHQAFAKNPIGNGFNLNLTTGLTPSNFGYTNNAKVIDDAQFGNTYGLQMGNRWYFSPTDRFGFGITTNWLEFSLSKRKTSFYGSDFKLRTYDFSLFQLGPIATVGVTDDIAIDTYYNLRPTLFITNQNGSYANIASLPADYTYVGVGFSHAIGAAFRWKVLSFGVDYVFGQINCTEADDQTPDQKLEVNNIRLKFGVKF